MENSGLHIFCGYEPQAFTNAVGGGRGGQRGTLLEWQVFMSDPGNIKKFEKNLEIGKLVSSLGPTIKRVSGGGVDADQPSLVCQVLPMFQQAFQ